MWPRCPNELSSPAPRSVLPMTEVNTILFDVGGVLLTNGWDHEERAAVLAYFSVDRAAYEERHDPANDAWEKGLITADEFLERTVFFEPRPFTPADFLARMKAQSKVLPHGALRILGDLRASHKVQLAILNNEARELNDYRIETFSVERVFLCVLQFLLSRTAQARRQDLPVGARCVASWGARSDLRGRSGGKLRCRGRDRDSRNSLSG